MSGSTTESVDAVLFFDANMPKMDACSANCKNKSLVFCKHRFDFNACLVNHSIDLCGLNDYNVTRFFLDLIKKNDQWNRKPRPIFVLITKDHNFIEDVRPDYLDELKKGTAGIKLSFTKNSIKCGVLKLRVIIIEHKPYGDNRNSDFRLMIEKLNRSWDNRKLSK